MTETPKPKAKGKKDDKNRPFSAALAGMKKQLEAEAAASKAAGAKASPRPATGQASRPKPVKVDAKEEDATFHRMMSGVVPIDGGKATRLPKVGELPEQARRRTAAEVATRAKTEAEEVHEHLRQLVDGATRFEVSDDGRRVEGRRLDLPPQAVRSLRRGAVAIDARLDLHGKASAEAREDLAEFLKDKRGRGDRCVLIIHGKGEHSPSGVGVLRGEIAAWLSQGRASEHVGAFVTALAEDGGEGAVYVLLRRDLG